VIGGDLVTKVVFNEELL